jgi:uncharacterized protein (DUF58 family)
VALRQGDAVGMSTFAGDKPRHGAPVKGSGQLNVLLDAVYDLGSTQRSADYQAAANQLLARQKRRALVVLVTNLRDEDEQLLAAVKRLSAQHRVLVASLREQALDTLRQTTVQTLPEALAYCGTIDFLNARSQLHERLTAHGVAVMDVRPAELGAGLVTSYMSWKKTAAI